MTIIHGFQLQREQFISELKTHARFYRHEKTGAELLSLSNEDENKVFGITFRTPPSDSTGIAHILEHSVLCGSRKYPVKEPFVELLKGSLQTFLNAFTYPDKTCYPVASQNLQDFYNLIDVYLDAVFYPNLTPFVFQQEGWHYELENTDGLLSYKGVVFNEMKGAYSSSDNVLSEKSLQSLFPDNTYGFDSGGNPRHIPDLTFEQFLAFHRKYYHPSNARIYFYGDDNHDERLRLVNSYLMDFDAIEIDSAIRMQTTFEKSRRFVHPFMVGKEETAPAKGMITLNWLMSETMDPKTNFSLRMLEYILLGMPASPLRKALIDSGLGEDIAGEGLGSELRQIYFSTGLKGIEIENSEAIEALIMETLTTLTEKGIDPRTVEAAVNTIEFRLRENNSGHFPQGLNLMLRSLTTWLYDSDPLALLAFEAPLGKIKSGLQANSAIFEEMIYRFFLNNPHRTTLILKPDPVLGEREEASEKDRLAKARAGMSPDQLGEVADNTIKLKRLQETPDAPDALASIPVLKIADLKRENKTIPLARLERQGTPVLFHDLFTNGIAYLDLGLNIHALPDKYLPYVPLFGRALVEMGTEKEDFVTLTQRISRKTGGIRPQSFISTVKNARQSTAWLFLRAKAMVSQTGPLMDILRDVLLTVRLDNKERFKQMILEEKARTEQKLVPAGHQVVNLRLRAHFGESNWAAEQIGGISHLFFLRELIGMIEKSWPDVLAVLEEIRRLLVNRRAMILNVTLDKKSWPGFERQIHQTLEAMPDAPVAVADWAIKETSLFEGMTIPSQVNYVGKGANLYELGYRFHGSALVITRYLRNSYLWDRVRVQGGAYGAFCLFDRLSGVLTFVSYRDPNLIKTIEAFDNTAAFLRDMELDDQELTKSIIGAIGDLDAHMLPDTKGYTSLLRYLSHDTEEARQQLRDEVLATGKDDFRAFGAMLEEVKRTGVVKVLGSTGAVDSAVSDRPGWLNVLKVL
ncbi:MAG: peptidase M16 [Desulfobacteraceae bacterium 4484_190.2]|nr:MAG: peptidase M16 [Desulfobacteraceae bacterium 4484_190.2]